MGWNGSGQVVRTNGIFTGADVWEQTRLALRDVRSDDQDTHDEDLANAIERTVNRDGENSPTANLPMGGFRHTTVGEAVARDQYVTADQVMRRALTFVVPAAVGGTGNAITLNPSVQIDSYAPGTSFEFVVEAANGAGGVTVDVNGLGPIAMVTAGNQALPENALTVGGVARIQFNGGDFKLVNPANMTAFGTQLTGLADAAALLALAGIDGDNLRFAAAYVGEMRMFAGATPPTRWLVCDGASLDRTTYAELFAVVGETYGSVDASSFNLPDLRGRSPMGTGQGDTAEGGGAGTIRALGDLTGAETHTLTIPEMPAHTHGAARVTDQAEGGSGDPAPQEGQSDSTGGDQPHNNVHPVAVVNHIIFTNVE